MSNLPQELEQALVTRVKTLKPALFSYVGSTVEPMTFDVPIDAPDSVCLFFWKRSPTVRATPIAGILRSWKSVQFAALVIKYTDGGDVDDARYPALDKITELHEVVDGFQPVLTGTEARWPIEPVDEYPVELETGECCIYIEWELKIQQSQGVIG